MLNRVIDFAIYNRLLVILALVASILAGFFILPRLNLDAFPDVTNIQVEVNTEAPGLSADNVEQLITYPIEAVMYALPDVEEVRSISKTGLSVVTIVFKENVDIYFARQQVFQQLQEAKEEIPLGIGTPEIGPNTSGLGQIFQYILRAEDPDIYDATRLRSLNDWLVKLQLLPVEGVTGVLSFGGDVLQYQVALDPMRLLAYDLTTEDVSAAITQNNRNAGGWYLDRGSEQLVIRGEGWLPSGEDGLQAIADIALKERNGIVVRVGDVADVDFGSEIRQGAVTMMMRDTEGSSIDLGEVVAGIVLKRVGANTKRTIDEIQARLPIIQTALPEGVILEPIYDQSDLVSKAVTTVVKALLQAFVLIFIVLLIFLVNIRASLLVMMSIPVSIGLALVF
ncbi:MAG: efflux RND transporter permease subunit, partial [Gammaproteobacteria bacterium]